MSNRLSIARKLALGGVAVLAGVSPAALSAAESESTDELTWLRLSGCSRAERSLGWVDLGGGCVRDHPAIGGDVATCAGHFCPAEPGEPGARIAHPSDFGQTE